MNRLVLMPIVATWFLLTTAVHADLQGMEEKSLEWLVDSSDAIVVGERVLKDHKLLRVSLAAGTSFSPNVICFLRVKGESIDTFTSIDFNTGWQLRVDDGTAGPPWQKFLTVDKTGAIISSHEDLIRRVQQRVRRGSSVPAGCDREAVEQGKSVKGGFRITPADTYQFGHRDMSLSDVYLDLLVPPDPEYFDEAKKALALPEGEAWGRFQYNRKLLPAILKENYEKQEGSPPDAEED